MNTTDILLAIDTQTIVERYGKETSSPDEPIVVASELVYALSSTGRSIVGSGDALLRVSVHAGDTISWRATSLDMSYGQPALFYDFQVLPLVLVGETPLVLPCIELGRPVLRGGVNEQGEPASTLEPLPVQGAPSTPQLLPTPYCYWDTLVKTSGVISNGLRWKFQIWDQDGQGQGYYAWDLVLYTDCYERDAL